MTHETDPIFMALVGNRIRLYRRVAGMTQQDLAYKSGIYRTYLSRIENGKSIPSVRVLATIARELNVEVDGFWAE